MCLYSYWRFEIDFDRDFYKCIGDGVGMGTVTMGTGWGGYSSLVCAYNITHNTQQAESAASLNNM